MKTRFILIEEVVNFSRRFVSYAERHVALKLSADAINSVYDYARLAEQHCRRGDVDAAIVSFAHAKSEAAAYGFRP